MDRNTNLNWPFNFKNEYFWQHSHFKIQIKQNYIVFITFWQIFDTSLYNNSKDYIDLHFYPSNKCLSFISRNSPVHCKTLEFEKMNLNLWKTDSPALQVPESVLLLTLEKGSQSLAARRKAEYEIWEHSKKILHFF